MDIDSLQEFALVFSIAWFTSFWWVALFDEAFQIVLDGVGGPSDRSGPDLGIEWQTFDFLIYMLQ